jgi:hypothetical protein
MESRRAFCETLKWNVQENRIGLVREWFEQRNSPETAEFGGNRGRRRIMHQEFPMCRKREYQTWGWWDPHKQAKREFWGREGGDRFTARKRLLLPEVCKRNSMVILDKSDFVALVEKLLDEGPYKKLEWTPLPKMKRETLACLSVLVLDPKLRWRLRETNPQVPRLYALPKIHKPNGKMRPIVSNISVAHEKMAK